MAVDGVLVEPLLRSETHIQHKKKGVPCEGEWEDEVEAWDTLIAKKRRSRVFFDHLYIAKDGGLTEIATKEELWYNSRYFGALLLLVFVIYNSYCIIQADLYPPLVKPRVVEKSYLLTTSLVSHLGFQFDRPEKIVFGFEITGLACFMLKALYEIFQVAFRSGYHRHYSLASLCWRTLPDLASYSAIKLLQFVVPQRLSYDLNYILWYEPEDTKKFKLALFILRTPVVLVIGLDCFLIKVRSAHDHIYAANADPIAVVMPVVILLCQILGVVQITKTINNRLYRFVFAGEDGMMTKPELVRQCVWEAMIADTIYSCRKFGCVSATALMLTWCDDDFQMMILNETDESARVQCNACRNTLVPHAKFCHHCGENALRNEEE